MSRNAPPRRLTRRLRDAVAATERTVAGRYVMPYRWRPPADAALQPPSPRRPDGYLSSYPKSGRNWISFALAHYLRLAHNLEPSVIDFVTVRQYVPDAHPGDPRRGLAGFAFADRPEVPMLALSHSGYMRGRFDAPVTVLLRDPRAVVVSF